MTQNSDRPENWGTLPSRGFVVDEVMASIRLDMALAEIFPELSRSNWKKLVEMNQVLVDGEPASVSYKLREGDAVTVASPSGHPDKLDLPIVYENDELVVFDKPTGVLTHAKNSLTHEATIASYMRDQYYRKSGIQRPGIVHRLDRDTSGLIVCAKNERTKEFLQKQFSSRTVLKEYAAVIEGNLTEQKLIMDMPIERNPKKPQAFRVGGRGKEAQTYIETLRTSNSHSLLRLLPKTGRTHQLRVHLAHLGHPIVGDRLYGGKNYGRLLLHARKLTLRLPDNEEITFESPLPQEFDAIMKK